MPWLGCLERLVPAVGVALAAYACGAGEDLAIPTTGALQIVTATSGGELDPDGFTVTINSTDVIPVEQTDTVSRVDLQPGSYTVALGGVAAACTLGGSNPRVVTVRSGEEADVTFTVTCALPPADGSLQVAVSTTGVNLDPNGYVVVIDQGTGTPVAANGTTILAGLPNGPRSVRLGGLAANCTIRGDNPRLVTVADSVAATSFEVRCWPPLTGRIAFRHFELDPFRGSDIYVRNADGTGAVNVTHSDFVYEDVPALSPDGRSALFGRNEEEGALRELYVVPTAGGAERKFFRSRVDADQPRWSRDGRRLLYLSSLQLFVANADGTGAHAVTPDTLNVYWATWSPDGTRIAYTDSEGIAIVVASGGPPTRVTAGEPLQSVEALDWSPDGRTIAFVGSLRGDETFSGRIMTIGVDGQDLTTLTDSLASYDNPVWSPDGSRLAYTLGFVTVNPRDPDSESTDVIYIMYADGTGARPFTALNEEADQASWSPR